MQLQYFFLNYNALSGALPDIWGTLPMVSCAGKLSCTLDLLTPLGPCVQPTVQLLTCSCNSMQLQSIDLLMLGLEHHKCLSYSILFPVHECLLALDVDMALVTIIFCCS